jgi:predicted PhzF superfamily epimerase YddE/YHI9
MKRPGQVRVRLDVDKGSLAAVRIAGTATIITEGTLAL